MTACCRCSIRSLSMQLASCSECAQKTRKPFNARQWNALTLTRDFQQLLQRLMFGSVQLRPPEPDDVSFTGRPCSVFSHKVGNIRLVIRPCEEFANGLTGSTICRSAANTISYVVTCVVGFRFCTCETDCNANLQPWTPNPKPWIT